MVGGVNLRIVQPTLPRAASGHKATVTKRDVIVPSLSEEERAAAVAEGGGGLGLPGPTRRVCLVCKTHASAYSCPRCVTPYCSVACYKGHNTGCTEGFYRRHVEGETRLRDAAAQEDGAGKRAAIEALRRVRMEGEGTGDEWLAAAVRGNRDEDEDEEMSGEERLAELAVLAETGKLDLGALTPTEEKAFMRAVASGEVGQWLEVWQAWWEGPPALAPGTGAPLVVEQEEVRCEGKKGEERPVDLPFLWRGLERWRRSPNRPTSAPPTKSKAHATAPAQAAAPTATPSPSPLLRYHLLDVLFAYAAVLRTYNGHWTVDSPQAAADLLALSAVLAATGGDECGGTNSGKEQQEGQPATPAPAALPTSAAGALAASLAALRRWDGVGAMIPQPDGNASEVSPALAMGLALARDMAALLCHGTLVACAIFDAYRIVRAAIRELLESGGCIQDRNDKEEQDEEEGNDLGALAARMERALGAKGKGGGRDVNPEEKEQRRQRRHEGRRLLRVLHKLRFLLAWADQGGRGHQQLSSREAAAGAAAWLLPLRAEVLVALREHEAVVVAGGGDRPRIKFTV